MLPLAPFWLFVLLYKIAKLFLLHRSLLPKFGWTICTAPSLPSFDRTSLLTSVSSTLAGENTCSTTRRETEIVTRSLLSNAVSLLVNDSAIELVASLFVRVTANVEMRTDSRRSVLDQRDDRKLYFETPRLSFVDVYRRPAKKRG